MTYCFNEPGGLGVDSKSVSSSGGNSASLSVRSSTSQTDELLVGFFTVSGTPAIIASSGYTVLQKTTSAPEILVESNLANAPENTNVTASLGTVENWSGLAFAIPLGNVTTTTSTSTSTSSLTASSSTLSSSTSSTASTSSTSTGSSGSPALDGTCNKENTRVTTEACSLSTSHADDILIAILGTASGSGSSSITDSLGLRWSNLASYHASSASHSIFIYWAVSPNLLSGDTVSTTQSQSTNLNLYVLAFQDVNLASPFDGTPVESAGDSASPSLTISNHNANEFVIGFHRQ